MIGYLLALMPWYGWLGLAGLVLVSVCGMIAGCRSATRALRAAIEKRRKFADVDLVARRRVNAEQVAQRRGL